MASVTEHIRRKQSGIEPVGDTSDLNRNAIIAADSFLTFSPCKSTVCFMYIGAYTFIVIAPLYGCLLYHCMVTLPPSSAFCIDIICQLQV